MLTVFVYEWASSSNVTTKKKRCMNWAHCHLQCRVDIVWFILRIFWFLYFVCLFELGLNKEGKCWLHLFMGTWASSSNVTTKKDLWLEPIFTCCAELTGYEASQTFFFISSLIMFVWSEVKLQFCWHLPLILRQKDAWVESIFTCSSELTEYEAFLQLFGSSLGCILYICFLEL